MLLSGVALALQGGQTRGLESMKAPPGDTGLGPAEGRALRSLGGQGHAHEEGKKGHIRKELLGALSKSGQGTPLSLSLLGSAQLCDPAGSATETTWQWAGV